MTTVYKLIDLQKNIDIKNTNGKILMIQPLEVNYTFYQNHNNSKSLVDKFPYFKISILPLVDHLRIMNATGDCLIKFSNKDVEELKKMQ